MINKEIKNIVIIGVIVTAILSLLSLLVLGSIIGTIICIALGLVLTGVFVHYTKQRYNKLSELNDYLSLVCAGKFDLDISDNTEGELSILKNNLYKVIILLRTQNEMLQNDKTYLSDSLADISHQLKTPLSAMVVMTDLLKDENDENKKKEFLSVIEAQLNKMNWLIQNLLKLSKLDSGVVEFKREAVDIEGVINESVKPFLVTLDLKSISFINQTENFSFNGDKNWTVEAFENILKNCIEHTDRNGEIVLSSRNTNVYDEITIKDTGCGIAKEDLEHIFERFYHGKNSSGDSVGIGLALAKTVFDKENAAVFVQSTEGEGSIFTIRFYKSII